MEQGMQGARMGKHSFQQWGKGLALTAIYCAVFLLIWRISFNQWYLPAGLRLACLMLLPMRYWPYIFAGDAAALLITRIPKAEQYSIEWAYLSPFLLVSLISLAPWYFRSRLPDDEAIAKKLPTIGLVAGAWSCLVGMTLNTVLNGPIQLVTPQNFISYTAGNYLGILMALLPCMLWRTRHKWQDKAGEIVQSIAVAVLMIAALFGAVFITGAHGNVVQLMPLVFMLLPAVYLTVLHGWPGAAIGTFLISAAVAFALPRTNIAGAFDGVVLLAQIIISVASAGLLAVGNHISMLFEKSTAAVLSEIRAVQALRQQEEAGAIQSKGLLHALFRSNDLRLRENALMLGTARHNLDAYRHDVVKTLKDDEQYERAMEAQASGMQAAKSLDLQRDSLYPLEIETHGLYAALLGPAFHDVWRQHARVFQNFRGEQRYLSLTLRLAVFRAIGRAMESMQDYSPSEYDIRIRVWRRFRRSGATVQVIGSATLAPETLSQDARDAFDELRARTIAFDGVLQQRQPCRIHFLMSEATLPE
jgi:MASE1